MVGLDPGAFADRFPSQLSGGQRQRIGVARALAADPPVILMDEPFGALDPITREQLQNEFLELETAIRKTILFVTHDVFEAVKMGDRIALLDAGRLQQLAPPADIVEDPANAFVDRFLGRHRFQLALLTRTVEDSLGEEPAGGTETGDAEAAVRLRARASLVEALDVFKKSGRTALPVFEGERRVGTLSKKVLLETISGALGEASDRDERP
jgi:osmoprotectant transport system ATP-binding protein